MFSKFRNLFSKSKNDGDDEKVPDPETVTEIVALKEEPVVACEIEELRKNGDTVESKKLVQNSYVKKVSFDPTLALAEEGIANIKPGTVITLENSIVETEIVDVVELIAEDAQGSAELLNSSATNSAHVVKAEKKCEPKTVVTVTLVKTEKIATLRDESVASCEKDADPTSLSELVSDSKTSLNLEIDRPLSGRAPSYELLREPMSYVDKLAEVGSPLMTRKSLAKPNEQVAIKEVLLRENDAIKESESMDSSTHVSEDNVKTEPTPKDKTVIEELSAKDKASIEDPISKAIANDEEPVLPVDNVAIEEPISADSATIVEPALAVSPNIKEPMSTNNGTTEELYSVECDKREERVLTEIAPISESVLKNNSTLEEPYLENNITIEEPILPDNPIITEPTSTDNATIVEPISKDNTKIEEPKDSVKNEEPVPTDNATIEEPVRMDSSNTTEAVSTNFGIVEEPDSEEYDIREETALTKNIIIEEPVLENNSTPKEPKLEDNVTIVEPTLRYSTTLKEPYLENNLTISKGNTKVEEPVTINSAKNEELVSTDNAKVDDTVSTDTAITEKATAIDSTTIEEPTPNDNITMKEPMPLESATIEETALKEMNTIEVPYSEDNVTIEEPILTEIPIIDEPTSSENASIEEPSSKDNTKIEAAVPTESVKNEESVFKDNAKLLNAIREVDFAGEIAELKSVDKVERNDITNDKEFFANIERDIVTDIINSLVDNSLLDSDNKKGEQVATKEENASITFAENITDHVPEVEDLVKSKENALLAKSVKNHADTMKLEAFKDPESNIKQVIKSSSLSVTEEQDANSLQPEKSSEQIYLPEIEETSNISSVLLSYAVSQTPEIDVESYIPNNTIEFADNVQVQLAEEMISEIVDFIQKPIDFTNLQFESVPGLYTINEESPTSDQAEIFNLDSGVVIELEGLENDDQVKEICTKSLEEILEENDEKEIFSKSLEEALEENDEKEIFSKSLEETLEEEEEQGEEQEDGKELESNVNLEFTLPIIKKPISSEALKGNIYQPEESEVKEDLDVNIQYTLPIVRKNVASAEETRASAEDFEEIQEKSEKAETDSDKRKVNSIIENDELKEAEDSNVNIEFTLPVIKKNSTESSKTFSAVIQENDGQEEELKHEEDKIKEDSDVDVKFTLPIAKKISTVQEVQELKISPNLEKECEPEMVEINSELMKHAGADTDFNVPEPEEHTKEYVKEEFDSDKASELKKCTLQEKRDSSDPIEASTTTAKFNFVAIEQFPEETGDADVVFTLPVLKKNSMDSSLQAVSEIEVEDEDVAVEFSIPIMRKTMAEVTTNAQVEPKEINVLDNEDTKLQLEVASDIDIAFSLPISKNASVDSAEIEVNKKELLKQESVEDSLNVTRELNPVSEFGVEKDVELEFADVDINFTLPFVKKSLEDPVELYSILQTEVDEEGAGDVESDDDDVGIEFTVPMERGTSTEFELLLNEKDAKEGIVIESVERKKVEGAEEYEVNGFKCDNVDLDKQVEVEKTFQKDLQSCLRNEDMVKEIYSDVKEESALKIEDNMLQADKSNDFNCGLSKSLVVPSQEPTDSHIDLAVEQILDSIDAINDVGVELKFTDADIIAEQNEKDIPANNSSEVEGTMTSAEEAVEASFEYVEDSAKITEEERSEELNVVNEKKSYKEKITEPRDSKPDENSQLLEANSDIERRKSPDDFAPTQDQKATNAEYTVLPQTTMEIVPKSELNPPLYADDSQITSENVEEAEVEAKPSKTTDSDAQEQIVIDEGTFTVVEVEDETIEQSPYKGEAEVSLKEGGNSEDTKGVHELLNNQLESSSLEDAVKEVIEGISDDTKDTRELLDDHTVNSAEEKIINPSEAGNILEADLPNVLKTEPNSFNITIVLKKSEANNLVDSEPAAISTSSFEEDTKASPTFETRMSANEKVKDLIPDNIDEDIEKPYTSQQDVKLPTNVTEVVSEICNTDQIKPIENVDQTLKSQIENVSQDVIDSLVEKAVSVNSENSPPAEIVLDTVDTNTNTEITLENSNIHAIDTIADKINPSSLETLVSRNAPNAQNTAVQNDIPSPSDIRNENILVDNVIVELSNQNSSNNSSAMSDDLNNDVTSPSTDSGNGGSELNTTPPTDTTAATTVIVNPNGNNAIACTAITNKLTEISEIAESLDAAIREVQEEAEGLVENDSTGSSNDKKLENLRSISSEDWHSRSTEDESFATASEGGNFTPHSHSSSFQTASGRTSSFICSDKNSFDASEADDSTFAFDIPELPEMLTMPHNHLHNISMDSSDHSFLSAQQSPSPTTANDARVHLIPIDIEPRSDPEDVDHDEDDSVVGIEELHSQSVTPTPGDSHHEGIPIESEHEWEHEIGGHDGFGSGGGGGVSCIADAPSMEVLTELSPMTLSMTPEVSNACPNATDASTLISSSTQLGANTSANTNKPNAAWRRNKYYENITKQTIKGFL